MEGVSRARLGAALVVGVIAVGASAVLIRLADAPPVAVAFWRCALGVGMLLPVALLRRERFPKGRTLGIALLSGVALGGHFGFWISSLEHTSVAASVVLVSCSPVFVAALAFALFGERTGRLSLLGIAVSIAGTAIIATDESVGSAAIYGNALALLGAATFALYITIGRFARTGGVGAVAYSIVAYASASATLFLSGLAFGTRLWGFEAGTWFWILAVAVGPQIFGHTVFNWALGYIEASVISGITLTEPVVSAVLAWLVLGERPGLQTVLGGVVVLVGLYALLIGRERGKG
ncbi:EamA-like transporter family [Rubrobacter radiotolerans]|uniref:DMT family transporter n=1 Tax=Rubrobacter radiotolerans TaxID=42256 RepID=A0A023X373_RUBRA|nr:DMT family transporter [Rubrobacter radiotolerans]AHY46519.1 EamA-like transporter family [Rubrobacter radiotolerans]MDX5893926.1 DMT family transporter [Rubrobacter radiotolerans]SMC04776.1 Threonine/homoserine efflux transporter RhtA [Rubrobacter radiotolerans DSM 5868]